MIYILGYTLEQAEELVEILNTVIQQSVASEIGNCVKKVSLVRMSISHLKVPNNSLLG